MKGGFIDSSTPLRKAILDKARRYGDLEAPFMVVVNAPAIHDRIDEMDALFGHEQFSFRTDRIDDPPAFSRAPNGVWVSGGHQSRYSRLSGVLLFRGIAPWSLRGAYACLYRNPVARWELPVGLERLPQAAGKDGTMTWREGDDISDILGRPVDYLAPRTSRDTGPSSERHGIAKQAPDALQRLYHLR
jgi:hypothetical protein